MASGRDVDVAIIGTGFSGLGMAIQLAEAGIRSFTFEQNPDWTRTHDFVAAG